MVVALGGNAIARAGAAPTAVVQREQIATAVVPLMDLVAAGHRLVVTHGNGPQVGDVLIQNEEAAAVVPPLPLDTCGAETQGMLGYWLVEAMDAELARRGLPARAVAVITRAVVASDDPALDEPKKPIGPFYTQARAERLAAQRRYQMRPAGKRGWRRVVPSPQPLELCEAGAIRTLLGAGFVVVAAGGGGVPVTGDGAGRRGLEAVVDKDLSARVLAATVGADELLILTDVPAVYVDWGTARQRAVARLTVSEGERLMAAGQFPAGSMGPKVRAAIDFVRSGGRRAVIAGLTDALAAIRGEVGTAVVPDDDAVGRGETATTDGVR